MGAYKSVEVDGIEVKIDTSFINSWDGVVMSTEMQRIADDKDATDVEKLNALIGYYTRAIANVDEIKEALGGDNAPFEDVFNIVSKVFQSDSQSKN